VLVALAGIGVYLVYRFWRKPMVTGNPTEMPPIVGPVTERLDQVAETMADKVLHRGVHPEPPPPADPGENNGSVHPSADEKKPAQQG